MATPGGGGASTFLAVIGVIISFGSMYASARGDISDPFVSFTFVVVAVVCAFVAGLNFKGALAYMDRWFDSKLEAAAEKALDEKMGDMEGMIDERAWKVANKTVEEIAEHFSK